jgi:hypothetical protein
MCKASEDVGKPSKRDCDANKPAHHASFTKMPSAFIEPLRSLICS